MYGLQRPRLTGFAAADGDVCVYEWYHKCALAPLAKIEEAR